MYMPCRLELNIGRAKEPEWQAFVLGELSLSLCVCVCVFVYLCVCKREREREREIELVS